MSLGGAAGRHRLWCLALPLVCLFTRPTAAGVLVPNDVIPSGGELPAVIAPGVTLEEESSRLLASLSGVAEAQRCNELCVQREDCDWFEFCDATGGCNTTVGLSGMPYRTCRLYAMPDCMLVPPVHTRGAWIKRLVGFPLRQKVLELPGFSSAAADGMRGGELPECPGTVIPGSCAFNELMDGAYACNMLQPTCQTMVVYTQGMDGCSKQVVVLFGDSPTNENTFVAPSVYSLVKVDSKPAKQSAVLSSQGSIVLPTDAQAGAGNGTQPNATAWQGCILVEDAVASGRVASQLDGVASAEDCCRACKAANHTVCNVWNWCPANQTQGCRLPGDGLSEEVTLTAGQCQLRFQDVMDPSTSWSMHLLSRDAGLPFVAGAPLDLQPQQLQPRPGFTQNLGLSGAGFGTLLCPEESLKPYLNICVLPPDKMVDFCLSRSDCSGFVLKQGWPGPPGTGLAAVAAGPPLANTSESLRFNPSTVLYLRDDIGSLSAVGSSEAGGLSAGAIAGIVAAAVAVAVACAAAALAVRRHRRRRRAVPAADKEAEEGLGHPSTSLSPLSPAGVTGDQLQPPKAAAGSLHKAQREAVLRSRGPSTCSPLLEHSLPSPFAAGGPGPLFALPSPFAADGSGRSSELPSPFASARATTVDSSVTAMGTANRSSSSSSAPRCSDTPLLGVGLAASSRAGSAQPLLPELAQHIAACDAIRRQPTSPAPMEQSNCAAAVTAAGLSGDQPAPIEGPAHSWGALPPALRDWVVDLKDVRFLRHPDGTLQELGSGASGVVHKALWHGEVIAAKSIDVGRSPSAREAFITEAMRLHQLRHAHMVVLYGVALSGSTGVLLLEFCAGRDLMSALTVEVAGFPGERLFGWYRRGKRIALEISKAINFLHAKSVVHMDVKSSNVLLTGMGVAKLADVGLARLQTGTFLSDLPMTGTFAWVAPEILMGGCRCTSAVDIYSLGVVLWEIVTGEQPMRGQLRIPRVPEECPPDVCELILECLSLEPGQRPTAQQVMRRLTPRSK